jgi:hypothetical protein
VDRLALGLWVDCWALSWLLALSMGSFPRHFQSLPEGAQVLDLQSKPWPAHAASPLGRCWTPVVQLKKLRAAGAVAADAAAESW